jgi:DNA-binding winged helix-turn-helix (wHTH) protein
MVRSDLRSVLVENKHTVVLGVLKKKGYKLKSNINITELREDDYSTEEQDVLQRRLVRRKLFHPKTLKAYSLATIQFTHRLIIYMRYIISLFLWFFPAQSL